MAYKENPREARQIEIHEGLLIQPDKGTGRGKQWLPDAILDTTIMPPALAAALRGVQVELKSGQRSMLKNGLYGAGQFSTTRNWKLPCVNNGAYSLDVHWIMSYYAKVGNSFAFHEHWYCAPGWLDEWQNKLKDKILADNKDLIDYFDDGIKNGWRTEEQILKMKDRLFKKYIHENDPKIYATYIENNPLCVQYDGTKNGLLNAMREVLL